MENASDGGSSGTPASCSTSDDRGSRLCIRTTPREALDHSPRPNPILSIAHHTSKDLGLLSALVSLKMDRIAVGVVDPKNKPQKQLWGCL